MNSPAIPASLLRAAEEAGRIAEKVEAMMPSPRAIAAARAHAQRLRERAATQVRCGARTRRQPARSRERRSHGTRRRTTRSRSSGGGSDGEPPRPGSARPVVLLHVGGAR